MYYIYEIYNKVSGKKYIGMTTDHFKRYSQHMQLLSRGEHTEKVMQKDYVMYGEDSFDYRLIDFADDKSSGFKKEKHYMIVNKTYLDEFGYNSKDNYFNKYQNTKDSINSQNFIYWLIQKSGNFLYQIANEIGTTRKSLIRNISNPRKCTLKIFNGLANSKYLDLTQEELIMFMGLDGKNYTFEELKTIWYFNRLSDKEQESVLENMETLSR